MQTFADYLKWFIENRGISYRKAAEMCGVDRTLLGRYTKGERMPSGKKVLDKIADGLEMDMESRMRLYTLYMNSKKDNKDARISKYIEKILCEQYDDDDLENVKELYEKNKIKEEVIENSIIEISDGKELVKYISYIIDDVTSINMCVDPGYEKIFRRISLLCNNCSDIDVECIVRLCDENNYESIEKISCLYSLYPILSKTKSCKIYHYYKKADEICEAEINFVISEKGLVIFDKTLCNGLFTNKGEYMQYYRKVFSKLNEKCNSFAFSYKREDITDVFVKHNVEKNFVKINGKNGNTICIEEGSLIQKFVMYMQYYNGINNSCE